METLTAEQEAFVAAVAYFLKGTIHVSTGIAACCSTCQRTYGMSEQELLDACENGEVFDEGGFSWSQCDSCGSQLGGNRYDAHGYCEIEGELRLIHMSVCSDCLCYIANGDIPAHWE